MEKTIEIKGIEETEAKNGKLYTKVKTQEGIMSCFEEEVIKKLRSCFGEGYNAVVEVNEVDKDGKTFRNIRKFIEATKNGERYEAEVVKPENVTHVFSAPQSDKYTTMYVSCAKDIFVCLVNAQLSKDCDINYKEIMEVATNLIKQARKEF